MGLIQLAANRSILLGLCRGRIQKADQMIVDAAEWSISKLPPGLGRGRSFLGAWFAGRGMERIVRCGAARSCGRNIAMDRGPAVALFRGLLLNPFLLRLFQRIEKFTHKFYSYHRL
jgi:hypothetical protein